MPFLILPEARDASGQVSKELAQRLCPYTEPPRRRFAAAGHTVWATSVARDAVDGIESAHPGGTSSFAVRRVEGGIRIATDPLGTCPIWYARLGDGWAAGPEAKALAGFARVRLKPEADLLRPGPRPPDWSPFEGLTRLAPGSALHLGRDGARVLGRPPELGARSSEPRPPEAWAEALGAVLIESFSVQSVPTACFVSGGIDSSIACALARRAGPVATFSLGTVHGDEFGPARTLAEGLDCAHTEVHLSRDRVLELFDRAVIQNEVTDGLSAEVLVQLALLHEAAGREGARCERVTTGYGSDLLFDGMLRVPEYMQAVGLGSSRELIERTRWTGELAPFVHWSQGLAAEHVFWRLPVIDLALSIPRELCSTDGLEKAVLRRAAVRSGLLPPALAFKPKVPLTVGTRANLLLSEALGLEDPLGYVEKTRSCFERLGRALRWRDPAP